MPCGPSSSNHLISTRAGGQLNCNFEMNLALHLRNMKCFFSDSIDKMVEAGITLKTLRGRRGVLSVVESFLTWTWGRELRTVSAESDCRVNWQRDCDAPIRKSHLCSPSPCFTLRTPYWSRLIGSDEEPTRDRPCPAISCARLTRPSLEI